MSAVVRASTSSHAVHCPCKTGGSKVGLIVTAVPSYDTPAAPGAPASSCTFSNGNPTVVSSITSGHLTNDIAATHDCTCENSVSHGKK